jgi:hypothetical protein
VIRLDTRAEVARERAEADVRDLGPDQPSRELRGAGARAARVAAAAAVGGGRRWWPSSQLISVMLRTIAGTRFTIISEIRTRVTTMEIVVACGRLAATIWQICAAIILRT